MNTQLQRASQLEAGTRLTQAKMLRAVEQMRTTLEQNGYFRADDHADPHAAPQASSSSTSRFAWSRESGRAWARLQSQATPE